MILRLLKTSPKIFLYFMTILVLRFLKFESDLMSDRRTILGRSKDEFMQNRVKIFLKFGLLNPANFENFIKIY